MDLPVETIILIVAVLIMAAVAFLELRYIRSKKQTNVDKALEQDDAYNAIATTKAVAASLRQAGRDTNEADVLLYQAESAYERREFINSLELAERAKTSLRNSKEKDLLNCPVPPPETENGSKDKEVPATAAKKLPANYLESKFIIDTVRCMLPDARPEVKEEGQRLLDQAQTSFDGGDYTEALKRAMKAKRTVGGTSSNAPAEKHVPAPVIVETKTPEAKAPPVRPCQKCGAELPADDEFCHACGAKQGVRTCPSCSKEAGSEDVFCRKCGARIDV